MELVENEIYEVSHTRKGTFVMQFLNESGDWVTGIITEGRTRTMAIRNSKTVGEEITIRKSFCQFKPLS